MWIVSGLLGAVAGGLYLFYRKRSNRLTYFKSLGIPGPEPNWLWGNMGELFSDKETQHELFKRWSNQYGTTYGFYKGPNPFLVTSDLEILEEVFIKKFSNFNGREMHGFEMNPDNPKAWINVFNARGQKWKRLRTIINPAFSSAKLKQMFLMVSKKVDILLERLQQAADDKQAIEIHDYYQALTTDVIADAAFGFETNSLTNSEEELFVQLKLNAERGTEFIASYVNQVLLALPVLKPVLLPMLVIYWMFIIPALGIRSLMATTMWIIKQLFAVIHMRQKDNVKRQDLLQLMLDVVVEKRSINDTSTWAMTADEQQPPTTTTEATGSKPEKTDNVPAPQRTLKQLTPTELVAQCHIFLLAGYETTSTTLACVSYLLATNPDKQKILQAEIDAQIQDDEEPTYEKVLHIAYLDWVINEALRMYPPGALAVHRLCIESCTVAGLHIPKGAIVQADVSKIHYDPELWGPTDPNTFEPERFSPENKAQRHPMAWFGFGSGPRNCVGMRFALMEAKITLVKILKRFNLETCDQTQVPMRISNKLVLSPEKGVTVVLTSRGS